MIRKKIIQALSSFDLPISEHYYDGSCEEWFTWNIADERGIQFEGENVTVSIAVQIHLFLEKDTRYDNMKKQIRKALINNGFTYPDIVVLFEDDTKKGHIVFSCETAESEALDE